jgi:hypothetical protein
MRRRRIALAKVRFREVAMQHLAAFRTAAKGRAFFRTCEQQAVF